METKKKSPKYSPEVRERAVRMVFEHQNQHASQWATIESIACKIGCFQGVQLDVRLSIFMSAGSMGPGVNSSVFALRAVFRDAR
jgi:transposase-like protein